MAGLGCPPATARRAVVLTAILAGIYTASIALSQRLLAATRQKSDMAIVLTTLVVVVVFTPIKNAVQATVDRRFPGMEPVRPATPIPLSISSSRRRARLPGPTRRRRR